MVNFILAGLLVVILGAAAAHIVRTGRSKGGCIGCPYDIGGCTKRKGNPLDEGRRRGAIPLGNPPESDVPVPKCPPM